MKVEDIIKYSAIVIGAGFVYNLIKGGGRNFNPLDPNSGTGFSEQEAQAIAERLYFAMADMGTVEGMLFSSLENLTGPQLIMVYNAFGLRPYGWTGNWFGLGYNLDLFGWFNQELNAQDLAKMKQLWAKTNLTWTI